MAIRNITFKSINLGRNATLVLCFTPPSEGLFITHFPVAWKVTTLAANGRNSFSATWTDCLAYCIGQIGQGQQVIAGNYTPIEVGETTTLQLDTTVDPPIYHFTEPKSNGEPNRARIINETKGPAPIGLGFITDLDTDREQINTALIYPKVGSGAIISRDFEPILSAYIDVGYQRTQMLDASIQGTVPIWSGNLLSLNIDTTIVIKMNASGGFQAQQLAESLASAPDNEIRMWKSVGAASIFHGQRVYQATLTFEDSAQESAVARCLVAIASGFLDKGYAVKLIIQSSNMDVQIDLHLPDDESFNQAEGEVLQVIERFGLPGLAAVKESGGKITSVRMGRFTRWYDVTPGSADWYFSSETRSLTQTHVLKSVAV